MRGIFRGQLLLALLAACNRTEEAKTFPEPSAAVAPTAIAPRSAQNASLGKAAVESAPNAMAAAGIAGAAAGSATRCVVPRAEVPPARAERAKVCPKSEGIAPVLARKWLVFPDAPGAPRISVEVAKTPAEHARGLMYRTQMPNNHGMIFEWPNETRRVFWMHDTCLPLDMLFIAQDRTIAGILEQVPVLNDEPRTVACPAAYVLEVNAGWTRRQGIQPGMRIALE